MDYSIIILILIAAAALWGAYALYRPKANSETAQVSTSLGGDSSSDSGGDGGGGDGGGGGGD